MLEQSAFSLDLSKAQAEQLHLCARQLWSVTLKQFLQTATVAKQRSQGDEGPRHRVRFGVYFHDTSQVSASVPETIAKKPRPPSQKFKP
jgi:hypothetical protein